MNCVRHCQITDDRLFSRPAAPPAVYRFFWRCRHEGIFRATMRAIRSVRERLCRPHGSAEPGASEALNLQAGEWVEVKPLEEILAGEPDVRKRFLPQMARSCGKRFAVRGRVESILCEPEQKLRSIKNTILLDGSICDGLGVGCDRSCFFFWREAWLKRVAGPNARAD